MRLDTILHSASALSARLAQPRFSTISYSARISRPDDCVTYTMSDVSASPSSFRLEMYACSSTFTLADGSSRLSFTGMGTRSSSFASSTCQEPTQKN